MIKRSVVSLAMTVLLSAFVSAQETPKPAPENGAAAPAIAITAETSPKDLARAAFLAQGGEKFRAVQNMVLRGSVQLYPPNSVQSIPGSFSLVTAGDRLRMEIDARPAIVFKQIYNASRPTARCLTWRCRR